MKLITYTALMAAIKVETSVSELMEDLYFPPLIKEDRRKHCTEAKKAIARRLLEIATTKAQLDAILETEIGFEVAKEEKFQRKLDTHSLCCPKQSALAQAVAG